MVLLERGKVKSGAIVFSEPLTLPEGTEVLVQIEPVAARAQSVGPASADFAALPFFGMWADREEMSDSAAWVGREREQWQQRLKQRD